eukprot:363885-Chlamydomonas_euryale.AAC.7
MEQLQAAECRQIMTLVLTWGCTLYIHYPELYTPSLLCKCRIFTTEPRVAPGQRACCIDGWKPPADALNIHDRMRIPIYAGGTDCSRY